MSNAESDEQHSVHDPDSHDLDLAALKTLNNDEKKPLAVAEIGKRKVEKEAEFQEGTKKQKNMKEHSTSATPNEEDINENSNQEEESSSHEGEAATPQEQELGSKVLQIQAKRYYIDVKQNKRGRFVKIAEVNQSGNKSRVLLAMSAAIKFRDHLTAFSELYSSLGPQSQEGGPENGKFKSEMIFKDNRRYYLDLKENSRGRFLKVSQTITPNGQRSQIAIPAQGLVEFRNAMTDLLEEFGTETPGTNSEVKSELPLSRCLKVENKSFFFDIGQNNRGVFMRISEVRNNYRTTITIPEKSWTKFRDIFVEYVADNPEPSAAPEEEEEEEVVVEAKGD